MTTKNRNNNDNDIDKREKISAKTSTESGSLFDADGPAEKVVVLVAGDVDAFKGEDVKSIK